MVEAQSRASTMRLVDSLEEQRLLEDLIDEVKPPVPPSCRQFHYLLSTPFRYGPYPTGSRFRRAGQQDGVFYASESVETAIAELAFYRLLFFVESPGTDLPARPTDHMAFSVPCVADRLIDLTLPPLAQDEAKWVNRLDYTACQDLADIARSARIEAIRYRSVRDPDGGCNLGVLTPAALGATKPQRLETWRLFIRPTGIQVAREFPRAEREFTCADFGADPRLDPFWIRP
ncbi:hypothetical protein F11_16510 [Rhodospirillum rubrum F11]|nr:hypothetical protein F11_16510 [Rhodospirillum rubrum F11]